MTQPPKPPPVIRAPSAPASSAVSAIRSMWAVVISKSSRIDACEAVNSRPTARNRTPPAPQRHRAHAGCRSGYAGRAAHRPVAAPNARSCTSRSDATPRVGCCAFARCPPRRILAAGMSVRRAGIDQQQRHPEASGSNVTGRTSTTWKSIISAVRGSPNSEASWSINPVGRADIVVLGALRDARLLDPVDAKARCARQQRRAPHTPVPPTTPHPTPSRRRS